MLLRYFLRKLFGVGNICKYAEKSARKLWQLHRGGFSVPQNLRKLSASTVKPIIE